jgi:LuxR family transcriptional regulator, maltose regulon positive regulatory protein
MSQVDPFLKTKLHIPFIRKDLVVRPRLLNRLVESLQSPLTLVTAPAGYGKSTLVTSALAGSRLPAAWLSLAKGDNQTSRFFSYLVKAVRQINPEFGIEALDILESGQPVLPERFLPVLINDFDRLDQGIALVLDDYQQISNPEIHEGVAFLLDHCPEALHVVIITRSDPPIPLARLRARGQVLELRAADLQFTEEEAASLLNEGMGLGLSPNVVHILAERTEGWAAGLQMAALSLRNRTDIDRFIAGFSGTNRYILDYLLEEVLANQPPEIHRFLLRTSILERICAPLCDALIQKDGPETPGAASSDLLKSLERENLFLVALDDERLWYRYHHLFAELLQSRLNHQFPAEKSELHRRAADWFEKEGLIVEAVNHALAGGMHDQAARLVEENTMRLLAKGEMQALMRWVEVLPADLHQRRPRLCIHQAYALAFAGKLPEVETFLIQAETAIDAQQLDPAERQRMRASIAAVRAMTAVMTGRDLQAIALANQSRELLLPGQTWDQATTAWALGYAERSLGHLTKANTAFEEMVQLARNMGNLWTLISGLIDLAMVVRAQGQIARARALFEEALQEARPQEAQSLGYLARMEAGLASVLYEQNELEKAQNFLSDAFHHMLHWPNPNHLAYAYIIQSRVLLAQGDIQHAWEAMKQADQIRQRQTLTRINRRAIEVGLVRVWIKMQPANQIPSPLDPLVIMAVQYISDWQTEFIESAAPMDESNMTAALMLARVLLSSKQTAESLLLLQRILINAEQTGNISACIEAQMLTALARTASAGGLTALEEALRLGQRGGYIRIFLDEGRPLQLLLAQWLARSLDHPLHAYGLYLDHQFAGELVLATMVETAPASSQSLPAPLTHRELEVLHLMAKGLTNAEIARQLVVSLGTVKTHTAAIYRKLDVAHRTEAIARARTLSILP